MNQVRGVEYEKQILFYIRQELGRPAYLWSDTPENILLDNGIIGSHNQARLKRKENLLNPLPDTGIDIIQMETDTICSLVQCKNGYKKGLTMSDLSGFMCWMASLTDKLGYVYYTDKLSHNICSLPNPQNRIKYIKHSYVDNNPVIHMNPQPTTPSEFVLNTQKLSYQLEAMNAAIEYYKDNDNGVLSMPCGTGKTYTSYLIAKNYKQIIIISPLKQFAKQNLDRYIEYGAVSMDRTLLVDSDGCRDVDEIIRFIRTNADTGFVISTTYDSTDVLCKCISELQNAFIIVDEFHNLSVNNVLNEDDSFNKIIRVDGVKKLFMSATPRVYELEELHDKFEEFFGTTIYSMTFNHAITNGYITDYRIWFPMIHEDLSQLRTDISTEIKLPDICDLSNNLYWKAMYLFSCLVKQGSRKCIVYCVNTSEITDLRAICQSLNNYYCLDLHIDQITSTNSADSRTEILSSFSNSKHIELLFSVRILDECIDIPSCDSIYLTYPSKSKIRTIQRLMRATRIDLENQFKRANIFIWCNEYDSILETLSGIKEYDIEFTSKVALSAVNAFKREPNVSPEIMKDITEFNGFVIRPTEYKYISWDEKLEMIKKYMNEHKRRPSGSEKDVFVKHLGDWINYQKQLYKNRKHIMKNDIIYSKWEAFINHEMYKEYFLDNTGIWMKTFIELKTYIDTHKKRPSVSDKEQKNSQLASWLATQETNYQHMKNIMKNQEIYKIWKDFRFSIEYIETFKFYKQIDYMFQALSKYIDENNRMPSEYDGNYDYQYNGEGRNLHYWFRIQNRHYICCSGKMKDYTSEGMLNRNNWQIYIKSPEYIDYFQKDDICLKKWNGDLYSFAYVCPIMLDKVKSYITKNKKIPTVKTTDKEVRRLAKWISLQIDTYNHIMANQETYSKLVVNDYAKWTEFIQHPAYSHYF